MRWSLAGRGGGLGIASVALLAACSSHASGGLVLTIETDVPLPKDVDTIELQVTANGSTQFDNSYPVGPGGQLMPATLTLLPGSSGGPVTIRLLAYRGNDVRMLREAITTIPTTRVATLLLPIQWLSFGMNTGGGRSDPNGVRSTCPSGQTPNEGTCASSTVDSTRLPTYAATAIFGGGDGTGNGQCYDLLGCFATSTTATPDESCTVEDPGGANVNFALALASSTGDGQCGAAGCLVPVPMAATGAGWARQGGRLQLPQAVCADHAKGTVASVVVSTKCPSATPESPLCGPWSSVGGASGSSGGGDGGDATVSGRKDAGDATVSGSKDAGDAATGCPRGICPVGIATGFEGGVSALAVDTTGVYWGDRGGNVGRVGIDGGAQRFLAKGPSDLEQVVVDRQRVYWITSGGTDVAELLSVSTDGGTPMVLATGQGMGSLAVDPAGNVYWNDDLADTVNRIAGVDDAGPPADAASKPLATSQDLAGPEELAVDSRNVYWVTGVSTTDGGTIMSIPSAGGAPVTLASGRNGPGALTVDSTGVYWVEFFINDVVAMGLDGGTARTLFTCPSNQQIQAVIATDAANVYVFCTAGGGFDLVRVPKGGGTMVTLATNLLDPESPVVTDASVFWAGGTGLEGVERLTPK